MDTSYFMASDSEPGSDFEPDGTERSEDSSDSVSQASQRDDDDNDNDNDNDEHDSNEKGSPKHEALVASATLDKASPPLKRPRPYVKRQRLAGHYNHKYIDLLNEEILAAAAPYANLPITKLGVSQFGGSTWSTKEKDIFFEALARLGRDDLPGIANAIGTKSALEVRSYLLALKEGLVEQCLNAEQHNLLSWVDVPAAVHVGGAVEEKLDLAAEALESKLWRRQSKRERQLWGDSWLIDATMARKLDDTVSPEKRGRKRQRTGVDEDTKSPSKRPKVDVEASTTVLDDDEELRQAAELFHSRKWITLQHNIFMNAGHYKAVDNWLSIATDEEEPSLLRTAFTDFYQLARSLTQRLIQASQFQAMVRQRALHKDTGKPPSENVERVDVVAALKTLNLPLNGREFWAYTARRCGVQVVSDHDGANEPAILSYDAVEAELFGHVTPPQPPEDSDLDESPSNTEMLTATDVRKVMMGEQFEEYAETVDERASHAEERALRRILGEAVEDEQEVPLIERPRVNRQDEADLADWRDWTEYVAVWE